VGGKVVTNALQIEVPTYENCALNLVHIALKTTDTCRNGWWMSMDGIHTLNRQCYGKSAGWLG